jgi:hypothetical protein
MRKYLFNLIQPIQNKLQVTIYKLQATITSSKKDVLEERCMYYKKGVLEERCISRMMYYKKDILEERCIRRKMY